MATPTLDTFVHDIVVYAGADFAEQYQLKWCETDDAGTVTKTPVDITKCAFVAQIKESAMDTCALATFQCKVIDPTQGIVELYLTGRDTAKIATYGDYYKQMSKYYWDLYITFPDGVIQRIVVGTAYVSPGIAIKGDCGCSNNNNSSCGSNSSGCYYCGARKSC